jgi:7-cyano-7-deazaguanine synthase
MKVVCVLSGGLDSTVMAYLLRSQGYELTGVTFDYGQRHRKEVAFAQRMAEGLGAQWQLIRLDAAGIDSVIGGSALTEAGIPVPEGHYAADNMRATVVPNRNAMMLTIAYAAAASWDARAVAIAVHAGDHPIYPDCRPDFLAAFKAMEDLAMRGFHPIELLAPFTGMTKADIVRVGGDLAVPFEQTWSCYKGEELHCGACGTCFERREAFELAGVHDATAYSATPVFEAPV